MRCTVKSGNERNPDPMFYLSWETARFKWEEGGMTSNQHGSYALGNTRATMDGTEGRQTARWSKSLKTILSSDCRLKFASMKLESLVIVDQNATVNTFSGLVLTARHIKGVGNARRLTIVGRR